jgi:hypothetical protein
MKTKRGHDVEEMKKQQVTRICESCSNKISFSRDVEKAKKTPIECSKCHQKYRLVQGYGQDLHLIREDSE